MGSWGGPTGLPPWLGVIWLSRFLGGRPGLLGGPAVFGFFLENRTEVLLPTSCAGVEDMLGPRPGAEKERKRVGEGPDMKGRVMSRVTTPWEYRIITMSRIGEMIWGLGIQNNSYQQPESS